MLFMKIKIKRYYIIYIYTIISYVRFETIHNTFQSSYQNYNTIITLTNVTALTC